MEAGDYGFSAYLVRHNRNTKMTLPWQMPKGEKRLRRLITNLVAAVTMFATMGLFGGIAGYGFSSYLDLPLRPVASDSQAERRLPWEVDPRVEILKSVYDTPVLMAYYGATLHDPLPGENYNISHAAQMLAGTVVWPGRIFSQNGTIGPYTKARGYKEGPMYAGVHIVSSEGGGVCKIASVLYNVATLCNLRVVERHAHSMTVPYVPPGQDATVVFGSFDFRFQNTTSNPILIWAVMLGNTLYIAFYGRERPPVVTWHHETLKRSQFATIRRYNPSLPPGTERESVPGQEGIVVRSWLTIAGPDGKVSRRNLGTDCYDPGPRVIEYGPAVKAGNPSPV